MNKEELKVFNTLSGKKEFRPWKPDGKCTCGHHLTIFIWDARPGGLDTVAAIWIFGL